VKDKLLEIDVRLLVLRYGRQRILKVMARLGEQTPEELERQLRTVEQRSEPGRTRNQKQSLGDVVAFECRERPELAEPLRAIAVNFENRTFLLRDVHRFLDRIGESPGTLKSRAAAGPALIRALSKMKQEELARLVARDGSPRESDYSLLSRAIMGAPASTRNEE
jgi:hypothetical protein